MSTSRMGKIARVARKHAERAQQPASAKESEPARKRRHARLARRLLQESLGGGMGVTPYEVFEAMVCLTLPPMLAAWLTDWDLERPLAIVPIMVAGVALMVATMTARKRALAAWREARLARVGHGFDVGAFLARLAERHRTVRLVAHLGFERAWSPEEQEQVDAAVQECAPGLARTWRGDRKLELESGDLDGVASFLDDGDRVSYFSNRPLHDCFAGIVAKVLPLLHGANPVRSLEVEVRGRVVSFDESAD